MSNIYFSGIQKNNAFVYLLPARLVGLVSDGVVVQVLVVHLGRGRGRCGDIVAICNFNYGSAKIHFACVLYLV